MVGTEIPTTHLENDLEVSPKACKGIVIFNLIVPFENIFFLGGAAFLGCESSQARGLNLRHSSNNVGSLAARPPRNSSNIYLKAKKKSHCHGSIIAEIGSEDLQISEER